MGINDKEVWVFDNSCEEGTIPDTQTIDCFTIITEEGYVFGCSANPFHPQGVGQFSGNINDWNVGTVKMYINRAVENPSWLGVEVQEVEQLPEDVVKYIKQIITES